MTRSQVWLSALVYLVLATSPTAAASCGALVPPWDNLPATDAVFHGTVTHVGTATVLHRVFNWSYLVTFHVHESWKGVTTAAITITVPAHPSVAVAFESGEPYLVYANAAGPRGGELLTTNGCLGTKPLAEARADLHALGAAAITVAPVPVNEGAPWRWVLLLGGVMSVLVGVIFAARVLRSLEH